MGAHLFSIYKIKNEVNGKCYIGMSKNVFSRFASHAAGSCPGIFSDIEEYGIGSFTFSIIEQFEHEDTARYRESFWIKHFRTLRPYGYNGLLSGGRTYFQSSVKIANQIKTHCDTFRGVSKLCQDLNLPYGPFMNAMKGERQFNQEWLDIINAHSGTALFVPESDI